MGSTLNLKGGVSNPKSVTEAITQANHGFVAGDAIRYNVATSQWVKAKADNAENAEVAGVVSNVITTNSFEITYGGYISISSLASNASPVLFLDSINAGGLTASPPSAVGTVIKPVLTKISGSSGTGYVVMNYLGTQIGGSSTVSIEEIQPVGTITPFAGSIIPDTWLLCDGSLYSVSSYPELYTKLQSDDTFRAPMYGWEVQLTMSSEDVAAILIGDSFTYAVPYTGVTIRGVVTDKTATTITVTNFPTYVSTPRFSFQYDALMFDVASEGGSSITIIKASNGASTVYQFSSNVVTRFRVPDLRGRFAIGTNTTPLLDTDGSNVNNSAISGQYPQSSFGGQESTIAATVFQAVTGATNRYTTSSSTENGLLRNIPPYLSTKYIIKAKPYTRAAIIEGLDVPYNQWLVSDIRDGSLYPQGSGSDLLFKTNNGVGGVEKMRLRNNGDFGLGTSSPVAKFDVRGTVSISNTGIFPTSTSTLTNNRVLIGGTASELIVWNDGSATVAGGYSRLSLGVKSPSNTRILSGAFLNGGNENTSNGSGFLSFNITNTDGSSSIERMRITSEGRVGIGTASPSSLLQVNGQISGITLSLSGKATSAGTTGSDEDSTLATKGYVDDIIKIFDSSFEVFPETQVNSVNYRDNRQTLQLASRVPANAKYAVLTVHSRSIGNAPYDVWMGRSLTLNTGHRVAWNTAAGNGDDVAYSNQIILPIVKLNPSSRVVYWNLNFFGSSLGSGSWLRIDVNGYI